MLPCGTASRLHFTVLCYLLLRCTPSWEPAPSTRPARSIWTTMRSGFGLRHTVQRLLTFKKSERFSFALPRTYRRHAAGHRCGEVDPIVFCASAPAQGYDAPITCRCTISFLQYRFRPRLHGGQRLRDTVVGFPLFVRRPGTTMVLSFFSFMPVG